MDKSKFKGTGKFWLGKGTLGKDVKERGEIPVNYITDERMEYFEKQGLIGKLIEPSVPEEKPKEKPKGKPKGKKEKVKDDEN
jgi:hypothetical protein